MTSSTMSPDSPTIDNNPGTTAPYDRKTLYALLAILGIAFVLRVWGIGFGLPYDFTPDELHEIVRALKLGAGEYSWSAGKGGLYYFLFLEYGVLYVYWWITGVVSNPTDFALHYLQDPSAFYLAGRITVALMGTATCLVVYHLGRRLYDWKVGLAAAFIGATAHYHGLWSHYINVDIGMTLAVFASFLAYTEYERNQRRRWLVGAGALAGIAFAFKLPGAIALLPLLLAISSPFSKWATPIKPLKEASILFLAMLLTSSAIAPENIAKLDSFPARFSAGLFSESAAQETEVDSGIEQAEFDDSVQDVTIFQGSEYVSILMLNTYVVLTFAALLGAAIGIWQRRRWDIIWCVYIAVFLGVMTAADRPGAERYMLPIVPALWLLAASAAREISRRRSPIMIATVAAIVAIPLFALIRHDYTWTQPDTRVMGKTWIEDNVPSGAKILMDGMRYRFIQSPPLNPDQSTVDRRLRSAAAEDHLSRGVSSRTLSLYAEAMARIDGPRYELYSTVWGLNVEDLSFYVDSCFDYIVTSSQNSKRFTDPKQAKKYPTSARFYQQLPEDTRFEEVYSANPAAWQIHGPSIAIYRVLSSCE
ncbi:MAG: glycosyltransferase family 39 protein [Woeseiaceae bacterium]